MLVNDATLGHVAWRTTSVSARLAGGARRRHSRRVCAARFAVSRARLLLTCNDWSPPLAVWCPRSRRVRVVFRWLKSKEHYFIKNSSTITIHISGSDPAGRRGAGAGTGTHPDIATRRAGITSCQTGNLGGTAQRTPWLLPAPRGYTAANKMEGTQSTQRRAAGPHTAARIARWRGAPPLQW